MERKKKTPQLEMASSSSVTNWAFCLSNYTCADPVGHWLAFLILRVVQIMSRWTPDRVSWHYSAVSQPCLYSRTTSFWCLQVFSASGTLTSQIVRKNEYYPQLKAVLFLQSTGWRTKNQHKQHMHRSYIYYSASCCNSSLFMKTLIFW